MAIIFLAMTICLAGVFLIGRRHNARRRATGTNSRSQLKPSIQPVSKTNNAVGQSAHSTKETAVREADTRKAVETKIVRKEVPFKRALPSAPLAATIHYTNSKRKKSVREVVIHSREAENGGCRKLNVREGPKPQNYLIGRISKLEYMFEGELYSLTSAEKIREFLLLVIPLKSGNTSRSSREVLPEKPLTRTDTSIIPEKPIPLADLLPKGGQGFAVIDLLTTRVGAHHRITEIAVIRLNPDGRLRDEWDSLLNPSIPTQKGLNQSKKCINDRILGSAPTGEESAGEIAKRLHGYVLVAHNLPLDLSLLKQYFSTLNGTKVHLGKGLNTKIGNESLASLCQRLGVDLSPKQHHRAIENAQALSVALVEGINHLKPAGAAVIVENNSLLSRDYQSLEYSAMERSLQATDRPQAWLKRMILLFDGAEFVNIDVPEAVAEALAQRLNLIYRRVKKISSINRPTFLLAESLRSNSSKMRQAKQQGLPVLLLSDTADIKRDSEVVCWVFNPSKAFSTIKSTE